MGAVGEHTDHYQAVAQVYDMQVFYDVKGPMVQWQAQHVVDKLALGSGVLLADVGAGTGQFTAEIARRGIIAVLVEPSKEMLAMAAKQQDVDMRLLQATAQEFASGERAPGERFDRLLMKEMLHHVPPDERRSMLEGLKDRLAPGGRLLALTRPHKPAYPLFEAARLKWEQGTPAAFLTDYLALMQEVGFHVELSTETFPMRLKKDTWYTMVRQRFWSCFDGLSESELEAGIQELESRFPETDELEFDEVELFIVASVKS
jgi:2-polyprenyl-3-methyl-5-hydroxy-6-metoxy-1,4-benzoquinol methylase